jgi:nucleotidyltransferase/DNA polymerase involved in DNA repair
VVAAATYEARAFGVRSAMPSTGAAAYPHLAGAQQKAMPVIGFLSSGPRPDCTVYGCRQGRRSPHRAELCSPTRASSEDAQKRPANTLARNRKDLVVQGLAALRKLELDSDRHERDGAVHGSHWGRVWLGFFLSISC